MDQLDRAERKLENLQKRELERQLNIQQYRNDFLDAKSETLDYVFNSFKEKENEILNLIKNSPVIPKDKLPAYFDNISKQILILQKYIASSNMFLRTYDIEVYQKTIQNLSMQLKDTEAQLMPKKKFGFRNKKIAIEKINRDVVDSKLNGGQHHQTKEITLDENYCGFKNEDNKTLKLLAADTCKKDVSLSNLVNCTVYIHGAPSTLHVSNIKNCTIYSGPVSTSIFADKCEDCFMFISCQQLRLHSSKRVDIYLHVTSRAIMEDCTQIQIAPYNYSYNGIEEDYAVAGLNRDINNWQCVDDFNWLNSEKKSPHWSILEEANRSNLNNHHA